MSAILSHLPFSWKAVAAPLHLLFYSTLLGTELYQTFVVTKICFLALPRSAFTTLQKRIFPVYFRGQTLLLFLTAVTVPGSLLANNTKSALITLAVSGVTSVLNLAVYGPRTSKLMVERIHQATRDSKVEAAKDTAQASAEMKVLNRQFSKNHAMSIHLNLISIGAVLWWGWKLAGRLQVN